MFSQHHQKKTVFNRAFWVLIIFAFIGVFTVSSALANGTIVTLTSPGTDESFKPGAEVEIKGTAAGTDYVTISVRNTSGGLIFVGQPKVEAGTFCARFVLPEDAVQGTYAVKVGAQGLDNPVNRSFTVAKGSTGGGGGEEPPAGTILTVQGSGVAKTYYFTLHDLKNAHEGIVAESYFSLNNYGTKKYFDFTGISLPFILDELVELKNNAQSVTVTATDGYYRNYNLDDVRRDYLDENNPGKKLPMILAWEENSSDLSGKHPLKLVMGQTGAGDINKQNWVSNVEKITVDSKSVDSGSGSAGNYNPEEKEEETVLDLGKKVKNELVTNADGRKEDKLTLDDSIISTIKGTKTGTMLKLTSQAEADIVSIEIQGPVLQAAQEKNAVIQLVGQIGTYSISVWALPEEAAKAQMLKITISKVPDEIKNKLNSSLEQGQSILGTPLEFTVEYTVNGQKTRLKSYKATYVERIIPLEGTVNANEATGSLWDEETGKFIPVPTRFETKDGRTYAVLLRRTNSVYAVIQQKKTFADIKNSWAQKEIEILASKMIINGKSAQSYAPLSNITRAEFSALLVRSLGLDELKHEGGRFSDVKGSEWFADSIAAAAQEGIVTGYQDGTFKPGSNITRQEMAVMIARAAKIAGKDQSLTESEIAQGLSSFIDQQKIAAWAQKDVAFAVKTGIINGLPGGKFSPQTLADRAQSAVMLKRFLTHINFMTAND